MDRLKQSLKVKAELYEQNIGTSSYRYPTGTRAWHAPVEVEAMDESWSRAVDSDFTLSITIPKGTTRRDSMQRVHCACSGFIAGIHHEVIDAHAKSLRTTVAKEEFIKACDAFKPKVPEPLDDLDAPLRRAVNSQEARMYAETLYTRSVDKAREQRAAKDKAIQELKEAEKKKLAEAAKLPPHKSLVALIDERIQAKTDDLMDEDDNTAEKKAAELVATLNASGNGRAPKAGSGSATSNPAQGVPKGQSNGKQNKQQKKKQEFAQMWGMDKSKRKGKGKEKGKGKGKGSNNGKGYHQQTKGGKQSGGKGKGSGHGR